MYWQTHSSLFCRLLYNDEYRSKTQNIGIPVQNSYKFRPNKYWHPNIRVHA